MEITVKQISSLEKIRSMDAIPEEELHKKTVLLGEQFSYQVCIRTTKDMIFMATIESELAKNIKLYSVKEAYMDNPVGEKVQIEDYITHDAGFMPDILVPLEESRGQLCTGIGISIIWVKVDVPKNIEAGTYKIRLKLVAGSNKPGGTVECVCYKEMSLEVVPVVLPEQKLMYTRWLYLDCISSTHGVEIFSEKHWALIEQYISAAVEIGINMILVPVHTPPLDTEIGMTRPCVQLVDIEKEGEKYVFDFSRFHRFICICKKYGIRYYEIAHMFSQWGAKCAPNIIVSENGNKDYLFGWHVAADSPQYISFLKQYIPAISEQLRKENIIDNTYFHISDEPDILTLDNYQKASDIVKPLIGRSKTLDALSNYEIYEKGFVECPVTSVMCIHEFLEHSIENQWVYYCCGPKEIFTNCFLAMPSYRTRIIGVLMYKYGIKGFLHWGYNFYNACRSRYPINPYLTTSCDKYYPSGDPFIVYPGNNCVYHSVRGVITYEAVQDMDICFLLEQFIGKENVVKMIDQIAGRELRFDDYPRNKKFLEELRNKMIEKIKKEQNEVTK